MALRQDYPAGKYFVGEDRRLAFLVFQQCDASLQHATGDPVPSTPRRDVAGWALRFVVRSSQTTDNAPILDKATGAGITIEGAYHADPALNTQAVVVTLDDLDTWDPDAVPVVAVKPATYHYSLKRTDPGGESILAWGKLPIAMTTTRA
jgi:hypothetical protein